MSFTLEKVVPWGRSFNEYLAMFSLTEENLKKKILGCGDGPASFNAELTQQGGSIISVDPLYQFSAKVIENRIQETYSEVMRQMQANVEEFTWEYIPSIEALGQIRMRAMQIFLADYALGKERYLCGELPHLNFSDQSFDIALCSHFLLLYSEQLSLEFHIQSIQELSRVAKEVRIFPLLELGAKTSRHLQEIIKFLEKENYSYSIKTVDYEFQKGGNQMLYIRQKTLI